jgi:hypothetical protein
MFEAFHPSDQTGEIPTSLVTPHQGHAVLEQSSEKYHKDAAWQGSSHLDGVLLSKSVKLRWIFYGAR